MNKYFLQKHCKYQGGHLDEEYQQVLQAFQRQLLQQEKILSGRHLELRGVMDPEKADIIGA